MSTPTIGSYSIIIPVMFCDIDGNGHVNNKHYSSYCDEAMMHMFRTSGIDINGMASQKIGPVIYKAEYEYKGELTYGDTARVTSTVTFPRKTRALCEHVIENGETGEIVCRARSYGTWINLETKRLHRFPDSVRERMLLGDHRIDNAVATE